MAGTQALERLQEMETLRTKESLTMPVWGNCWTTGMLPGGFEASAQKAALLEWQNQNPVFQVFSWKPFDKPIIHLPSHGFVSKLKSMEQAERCWSRVLGGLGRALPSTGHPCPGGWLLPGPTGATLECWAVQFFGMQDMGRLLATTELGCWFLRVLPH